MNINLQLAILNAPTPTPLLAKCFTLRRQLARRLGQHAGILAVGMLGLAAADTSAQIYSLIGNCFLGGRIY